jgi:hypothetical protein
MHARIDDLLSIRDAEPVDAAMAAHVEECPTCTEQLRKLSLAQTQLRALPQLEPPDASWGEIQARLANPAPRGGRYMPGRIAAALALMVLSVITVVALRDDDEPIVGEQLEIEPLDPPPVAELVAQSRQLEDLLQRLPDRPRIERVSTAATIDTIERRIQLLDFQLTNAAEHDLNEEQSRRLWSERVALMDSLVKVRYAEGVVTF